MRLQVSPAVRTAAKNLLWKLLSSPLEKASRMLVVFVAAPMLGPSDFGAYQFLATVASLLLSCAELGVGTWSTRAIARRSASVDAIVASGARLRAATTVPYVVIIAAIAIGRGGADARALPLLAVAALMGSLVDYLAAILRGLEDFRLEAVLQAVRATVSAGVGILALAVTRSAIAFAAGLALGGAIAGGVDLKLYLARSRLPLRATDGASAPLGTLRELARRTAPLWFTGLLATLYFRVDLVLVRVLTTTAESGYYAAAGRVFEATTLLAAPVMAVAFPRLAADEGVARRGGLSRLEAWLLFGMTGAGVALAAGIFVLKRWLVLAVLGVEYAPATPLLGVLALAIAPLFANFALCDIVIARGRERVLSIGLAGALAVNVGFDVCVIPRIGALGAAWGTVLCELVVVAACWAGVQRLERRAG